MTGPLKKTSFTLDRYPRTNTLSDHNGVKGSGTSSTELFYYFGKLLSQCRVTSY